MVELRPDRLARAGNEDMIGNLAWDLTEPYCRIRTPGEVDIACRQHLAVEGPANGTGKCEGVLAGIAPGFIIDHVEKAIEIIAWKIGVIDDDWSLRTNT